MVVLPRVSTAGRWRMMARRRAMRATPMASVTVTAAGRPSGIAPTASATAAMNISKAVSPRARPIPKVSKARPPIAQSSQFEKAVILRVSGVTSWSAPVISPAMRPVSVASPVAMTMPLPSPAITVVPA